MRPDISQSQQNNLRLKYRSTLRWVLVGLVVLTATVVVSSLLLLGSFADRFEFTLSESRQWNGFIHKVARMTDTMSQVNAACTHAIALGRAEETCNQLPTLRRHFTSDVDSLISALGDEPNHGHTHIPDLIASLRQGAAYSAHFFDETAALAAG